MTPTIMGIRGSSSASTPCPKLGSAPPCLPNADDAAVDDLLKVYALLVKEQSHDLQAGALDARDHNLKRQEALRKWKEEIDKKIEDAKDKGFFKRIGELIGHAVENFVTFRYDKLAGDAAKDVHDAMNSPKFWRDLERGATYIAKIAATVAACAATGLTGGAAGPGAALVIAGVVLSTGGTIVSETEMFGKDLSSKIGLGMSLGGAGLSFGSSFITAGAGVMDKTGATIRTAAEATKGGAEVVQGIAHVKNAHYEAEKVEAQAREKRAKMGADDIQRQIVTLFDDLKAAKEAKQRGQEIVAETIETRRGIQLAAMGGMRG